MIVVTNFILHGMLRISKGMMRIAAEPRGGLLYAENLRLRGRFPQTICVLLDTVNVLQFCR